MRGPAFIIAFIGVWTSSVAAASPPAAGTAREGMLERAEPPRPLTREPFVVTDRAWVKREPRAKAWVAARSERAAAVDAEVAHARSAAGAGLGQVVLVVGLVMLAAFIPSPKALLRRRQRAQAIREALREPGVLAGEGAISLARDDGGALSIAAGARGGLSVPRR
ncbi:hypothetical protein L6R52_19000 [Myxococcota bacterium]|nr:hypothetical protein [Myxococcota bacterium]